MKKIVTFLLALILMIGSTIVASRFMVPKIVPKADTIAVDSLSQEMSQQDNKLNKIEETKNEQIEKDNINLNNDKSNTNSGIKEMSVMPAQNTKHRKGKIEKRRFTESGETIDDKQNKNTDVTDKNSSANFIAIKENNNTTNLENNENNEKLSNKDEKNIKKSVKNNNLLNKNFINKNITNNVDTNSAISTNIEPREESSIENADEHMELCVIGSASKSVSPDYAKITAVIETLDSDKVKAKDTNFSTFEKVLQALKGQGIDEDDIVLESYTSYPNYDYSMGRNLAGYYTITTFTFNVDNLDNIKTLVDTATENGVTSIRNINYELSNMDEVYQDVLMEAIDNAKSKAEKISGGDVTVKSVKEEYVYSCTNLYRTYAENISQALMGCIDVEARVTVEFE